MKSWIYINGDRTKYKISSKGFVISTAYRGKKGCTHKLKHNHDRDGYCIITLNHQGKKYTRKIHRLVAEAFIPNPHDLPEVNHKDGNKDHNDSSNLEWMTTEENIHHALDNDLRYRSNSEEYVEMACQMLQDNDYDLKTISKLTGIERSMLIRIKNGKRWKSISCKYDFSDYDKTTRASKGSSNGSSKIDEDIADIICKHLANHESPTDIAKLLDVPRSIIYKIRNHTSWMHVSCKYDF